MKISEQRQLMNSELPPDIARLLLEVQTKDNSNNF